MKYLIALFIIGVLAGCGNATTSDTTDTPTKKDSLANDTIAKKIQDTATNIPVNEPVEETDFKAYVGKPADELLNNDRFMTAFKSKVGEEKYNAIVGNMGGGTGEVEWSDDSGSIIVKGEVQHEGVVYESIIVAAPDASSFCAATTDEKGNPAMVHPENDSDVALPFIEWLSER